MRLVLIGIAAGFASALFGVGGGLVIVPLLILLVGYDERPAMATSIAAAALVSLVGVVTYALHGHVAPAPGALVGLPAALGAIAGANLQQRVPTRALSLLFALFVAVIAGVLLVR